MASYTSLNGGIVVVVDDDSSMSRIQISTDFDRRKSISRAVIGE